MSSTSAPASAIARAISGTPASVDSRMPMRPIAVSKTRAQSPGTIPHSSRSNRVSISLSWCPRLPSGAISRARFTALPSDRRSGADAAQTCSLNSRARLECRSSTSLIRAVTASIERCGSRAFASSARLASSIAPYSGNTSSSAPCSAAVRTQTRSLPT